MRGSWTIVAILLTLALVAPGPAQATNFLDDNCLENPFVVDTLADAARVANGYDCPGVDLVIKTSLTGIIDPVLPISAKSITITGPDVLDPAKRVEIINDVAGSVIRLLAENGDIRITEGSVKAHALLDLTCQLGAPCKIVAEFADLIASTSFSPPGPGGDLNITANGDVDIKSSNVHGGKALHIKSLNGGITLICKSGDTVCKDPLTSGKVEELCGSPPVFPCTPTFNTPNDLKAVCIGAPGVTCNGGSVEKRFSAKFDIDITGSTIISIEHMTFQSSDGALKASGATLQSNDNIRIDVKNGVDLSKAHVTTSANVIIYARSGCPAPPGICINLREATMEGKDILVLANNKAGVIDACGSHLTDDGPDFPTLNGDSFPPYSPNVLDDAGECPSPPGPGVFN